MSRIIEYTRWLKDHPIHTNSRSCKSVEDSAPILARKLEDAGFPRESMPSLTQDNKSYEIKLVNPNLDDLRKLLELLGANQISNGCYSYGGAWIDLADKRFKLVVYCDRNSIYCQSNQFTLGLPLPLRSNGTLRIKSGDVHFRSYVTFLEEELFQDKGTSQPETATL